MKAFVFAFVMTLGMVNVYAWEPIPTETGNYCKDQGLYFLRHQFGGQNITVVEKGSELLSRDRIKNAPPTVWTEWWSTSLCSGYFVMEFRGHKANCKRAHYGSVPAYLKRVRATGECLTLIPEEQYPTPEQLGIR